jgi:hypothetical protein
MSDDQPVQPAFTLGTAQVGEHKLARPGVWIGGAALLTVFVAYFLLSALYGKKK